MADDPDNPGTARQLTVRWFAFYREVCGTPQQSVRSGAATPLALFDEMTRQHPGLERFAAARVAVNDALVDWETPLADGDEVLFFPPVAGG